MTGVTLDSNEYISAFNFRGRALELIHLAISGEIEIAISNSILDEVLRVLREKFGWQPYDLLDLRQRLLKTCHMVEPKEILRVLVDEPDNRILECAQEAKSEFIITEDGALLKLGKHAEARILRATDFLESFT